MIFAHLAKDPRFRYCTESPEDERFIPELQRMLRSSPGRFLSVDYTSATDGVDGSFMAALMERILMRSGDWTLKSLCHIAVREMMMGRDLLYPDRSVEKQRRGTLMGSLLSFPILCLWNESILRRTGWRVTHCSRASAGMMQ
nr:RNA-dependent RNA polymerase [Riboviria sp.]